MVCNKYIVHSLINDWMNEYLVLSNAAVVSVRLVSFVTEFQIFLLFISLYQQLTALILCDHNYSEKLYLLLCQLAIFLYAKSRRKKQETIVWSEVDVHLFQIQEKQWCIDEILKPYSVPSGKVIVLLFCCAGVQFWDETVWGPTGQCARHRCH